jgi:branched-chain amino acid transport system ATP-binding protein
MLEVIDIHTFYGESQILYGVNLKVKTGLVVALLGRNGMGKTTTLHSIIGFAPPRRGKIIFCDEEVTQLPSYSIARRGIALVPQGRRIFPSLSVKENLTVGARSKTRNPEWTLERIYRLFPALKIRHGIKANLLSGGEQQMLTIGRALMTNPTMLLMDEPSEGLAPKIVEQVTNNIKELRKSGLSILLVEQNVEMAMDVADYIYMINKGTIVYESTPEELQSNEDIKNLYIGISK